MRAAGYPIDQAAISKIERDNDGVQPRRIDLNEGVGFATVFGCSFTDMLGAMPDQRKPSGLFSVAQEDEVRRLVEEAVLDVLTPQRQIEKRTWRRITPALLEEVADVYRRAVQQSVHPTAAVASGFAISSINASKWVRRARDEGFLGESDGTRGGELQTDA